MEFQYEICIANGILQTIETFFNETQQQPHYLTELTLLHIYDKAVPLV